MSTPIVSGLRDSRGSSGSGGVSWTRSAGSPVFPSILDLELTEPGGQAKWVRIPRGAATVSGELHPQAGKAGCHCLAVAERSSAKSRARMPSFRLRCRACKLFLRGCRLSWRLPPGRMPCRRPAQKTKGQCQAPADFGPAQPPKRMRHFPWQTLSRQGLRNLQHERRHLRPA